MPMGAGSFHYELRRTADDRVDIALRGDLEGPSLSGLDTEIDALLDTLPPGGGVAFDLTAMTHCAPPGCRALARVQRKLGAHRCRTVWLANVPRIRGAAWWIVHASGDSGAMPVTDPHLIDHWLTTGQERPPEIGPQPCHARRRAEWLAPREESGRWSR